MIARLRAEPLLLTILAMLSPTVTLAQASPSSRPAESSTEPTPQLLRPALTTSELRASVTALVQALDSHQPQERDKATEQLLELGEPSISLLEQALEDLSRPLTVEQRERIRVILDGGPIEYLESTSGLSNNIINTLRSLRPGASQATPDLWDSHWIDGMRQLEQASLNDAGVALLATLAHAALPPAEQSGDTLYASQRLGTLEGCAYNENAGELTTRVLNKWVREWYIPSLKNLPESSDQAREPEGILTRLLIADRLSPDAYERFHDSICRVRLSSNQPDSRELSENLPLIIGLCYSRHATSRHIGKLLTALMEDYRGSNIMGRLALIGDSPYVTDAHPASGVALAGIDSYPQIVCNHSLSWSLQYDRLDHG